MFTKSVECSRKWKARYGDDCQALTGACSGAGEIALAVVESRRYNVWGDEDGTRGEAGEVNTVLDVVEWAGENSACCGRSGR